ncbi:hypothetical protein PanWU01x14_028170, partial [Parasponia andersonii]
QCHRGAAIGRSGQQTFDHRWRVARDGASGLKAGSVVACPIGRWLGDFVSWGPQVKMEGN